MSYYQLSSGALSDLAADQRGCALPPCSRPARTPRTGRPSSARRRWRGALFEVGGQCRCNVRLPGRPPCGGSTLVV